MGNLVLSVVAIAAISVAAIQIAVKDSQVKNGKMQTKSVLKYEKAIKTTGSSYANLGVKGNMVFITNNTRDKVILNKISKAVNDLIKSHPNATDFSCSTLASTGDVSESECNEVKNKKYAVILPSNKAVTNNTNSLVKKINTDNNTVNKVIVSEVSSSLAPNAKAEKTYVTDIKDNKKAISASADVAKAVKITKVEKTMIKTTTAIASMPMRFTTPIASSKSREDRHEVGSVASVMKAHMSSLMDNMRSKLSSIKSDDTLKSRKTTKDTEKDNSLFGFFK